MLEVDASEAAKQAALNRMNSPASCTTTIEILNFFYNDITELEQEQHDEITFESWLEEMISFNRVGRHIDRKYAATLA